MPRGKASQEETVSNSKRDGQLRRCNDTDEWAGFVPCSIVETDRESFDIWFAGDMAQVTGLLDVALANGLKFTLVYDGANMSYVASFIGRPDVGGERAFRAVLSGRAGTFDEAIAVLCFKHFVMLHGDWWESMNAPKTNRFMFG